MSGAQHYAYCQVLIPIFRLEDKPALEFTCSVWCLSSMLLVSSLRSNFIIFDFFHLVFRMLRLSIDIMNHDIIAMKVPCKRLFY